MPLQLLPLFEFPRPGDAPLLLQMNVRELEQGAAQGAAHVTCTAARRAELISVQQHAHAQFCRLRSDGFKDVQNTSSEG